jgi:hypothetical protein
LRRRSRCKTPFLPHRGAVIPTGAQRSGGTSILTAVRSGAQEPLSSPLSAAAHRNLYPAEGSEQAPRSTGTTALTAARSSRSGAQELPSRHCSERRNHRRCSRGKPFFAAPAARDLRHHYRCLVVSTAETGQEFSRFRCASLEMTAVAEGKIKERGGSVLRRRSRRKTPSYSTGASSFRPERSGAEEPLSSPLLRRQALFCGARSARSAASLPLPRCADRREGTKFSRFRCASLEMTSGRG